jgi:hypothetical protein
MTDAVQDAYAECAAIAEALMREWVLAAYQNREERMQNAAKTYAAGDIAEAIIARAAAVAAKAEPVGVLEQARLAAVLAPYPIVKAHQISNGLRRETIDPLQRYVRIEDILNAASQSVAAIEPPAPWTPPDDRLRQLRSDHAEWSQAQFGNVSAIGPAKHLSKEALEVAADPTDVIEHADCWMLLWDMQRRAGITDDALTEAIGAKLAINKARKWSEPKEGEAREHSRTDAFAPLPGDRDE